jgi:hypothetical protein
MTLAHRQAAVVAALVAGADLPAGFDPVRVQVMRAALLRKRSGEVARAWPMLAAAYGDEWVATFSRWAHGRAPAGSLRDGWDFARAAGDTLPAMARPELADREARLVYDGASPPRPRRWARWRSLRRRP